LFNRREGVDLAESGQTRCSPQSCSATVVACCREYRDEDLLRARVIEPFERLGDSRADQNCGILLANLNQAICCRWIPNLAQSLRSGHSEDRLSGAEAPK